MKKLKLKKETVTVLTKANQKSIEGGKNTVMFVDTSCWLSWLSCPPSCYATCGGPCTDDCTPDTL